MSAQTDSIPNPLRAQRKFARGGQVVVHQPGSTVLDQFRLVPMSQVIKEHGKISDIPLIDDYPRNTVFSPEIGGVAFKDSPKKGSHIVVQLPCINTGKWYWVSKSLLTPM